LAGRLQPQNVVQGNLFFSSTHPKRFNQLMGTMDDLNKQLGSKKLYFATCGPPKQNAWARKEQWCSPRYTTRWGDILEVK